jgi:hypothetical protein
VVPHPQKRGNGEGKTSLPTHKTTLRLNDELCTNHYKRVGYARNIQIISNRMFLGKNIRDRMSGMRYAAVVRVSDSWKMGGKHKDVSSADTAVDHAVFYCDSSCIQFQKRSGNPEMDGNRQRRINHVKLYNQN